MLLVQGCDARSGICCVTLALQRGNAGITRSCRGFICDERILVDFLMVRERGISYKGTILDFETCEDTGGNLSSKVCYKGG